MLVAFVYCLYVVFVNKYELSVYMWMDHCLYHHWTQVK